MIDNDKLTKDELLLVYLLNHNNLQDHYVVPDIITEQGIQNALNCDLGHISRMIKKIEEKGYIFRTLSKIENKKRKRNVFFLTEEGLKVASELTNMSINSNLKNNTK